MAEIKTERLTFGSLTSQKKSLTVSLNLKRNGWLSSIVLHIDDISNRLTVDAQNHIAGAHAEQLGQAPRRDIDNHTTCHGVMGFGTIVRRGS
jgi:hypothetical protein